MANQARDDGLSEDMSLAEVAHSMKGLIGIFDMISSTFSGHGEMKDVFDQGLERLRELSCQVDQCALRGRDKSS